MDPETKPYYVEYVLDCLLSSEVRLLPPAEEIRSWDLPFELLEYIRVCLGREWIRDQLSQEVSPEGILERIRGIVEEARSNMRQFYGALAVATALESSNSMWHEPGRKMCRPDLLAEYLEGDILEAFTKTERAALFMTITCFETNQTIAMAMGLTLKEVDHLKVRIHRKIEALFRHHMRQYDSEQWITTFPKSNSIGTMIQKAPVRWRGSKKRK